MSTNDHIVHFVAGGVGGTAGAILTCPLEVVKTRLQSSMALMPLNPAFRSGNQLTVLSGTGQWRAGMSTSTHAGNLSQSLAHTHSSRSVCLMACLRHITLTEGVRGLFKGLGPNLIGVAPSRAIYFFSYANVKKMLNSNGVFNPNTPMVHVCSAVTAGFTACTLTNPIWFIKTRLQLDQKRNNSLTCRQCIANTLKNHGWAGFYKGISASYVGITETVIHFVIYEAVKAKLLQYSMHRQMQQEKMLRDFLVCMLSGAVSKSIATCIAYPHEVVRTRLREEGNKYRTFGQTLLLVAKEDGYHGLYRGLTTQLIRQIPNTAIMMATYEAVVYLFSSETHS